MDDTSFVKVWSDDAKPVQKDRPSIIELPTLRYFFDVWVEETYSGVRLLDTESFVKIMVDYASRPKDQALRDVVDILTKNTNYHFEDYLNGQFITDAKFVELFIKALKDPNHPVWS